MTERRFGISTHLFHGQRLTREHLVHIAAHGFDDVEVFATRSHFDYHDVQAVEDLAEWLADTGLALHSVHAPAFEGFTDGRWVGTYSNAASIEARRQAAVDETAAALAIATRLPFRYLVTHVGVPDRAAVNGDNQPEAARRSVEQIAALAAPLGVRVALEVMPNALSSAQALTQLIEDQLDGADVGVCLDYGHAHLMGDVCDAIETLSGHLWTTHVHDNHGRADDHLVPFAGGLPWNMAMMGTQKIGYDGTLLFEVGDTGDPVEVLRHAVAARDRLEQSLVTF